ncbi:membrane-associated protein, putative [Bodo saltans]|uniref:Membrane-associated protein, putative n=1 Tax=Bodo saltans TaxID=75058 RepID=A0A0S4J137_BODSA|nr:membrane-associated protein, putative [Bodo saltans]|eukprot:CUG54055.1 membrane-associated protein, putative [Bodo saltans]
MRGRRTIFEYTVCVPLFVQIILMILHIRCEAVCVDRDFPFPEGSLLCGRGCGLMLFACFGKILGIGLTSSPPKDSTTDNIIETCNYKCDCSNWILTVLLFCVCNLLVR